MRTSLAALALSLLAGCGNKVDHPDAAAACNPAVMRCVYTPPETGQSPIGGGDGGASSGDPTADWSGRVVAFNDDYFDQGMTFTGVAQVSAIGRNGARVSGSYDGAAFELTDVLKTSANWLLVDPASNQGVLPTVTVADTRVSDASELVVGVARQLDVEAIYQLSLAGEPSAERAQVVLRVVDGQERSVSGVTAELTAEVVAYRLEGTWDASEGGATDDSGMIFLGNVPATTVLDVAKVNLRGTVNAQADIRLRAGATTVVTVRADPP